MNEPVISLVEHVASDLAKLRRRLAKEGWADLTQLPYDRYLNTALWTKIKNWVRARDRHRCRLCGTSAHRIEDLDVHHRAYDLATLEGLDDSKLISLCRSCHNRVEQFADGQRRTNLRAKEEELARLMDLFQARQRSLLVSFAQTKSQTQVSFVGDSRLLEIAPFWHFISGVMHAVWLPYKDLLRMPLPFGREKFFQPSGARMIHIPSNRPWLTFHAGETSGSITAHKGNEVSVLEALKQFTDRAGQPGCYWRLQA